MESYFFKEVEGNLIEMALQGQFDVIVHGCNCFCSMGAGIAPQMAKAFGAHTFRWEAKHLSGNVNKLGLIDYQPKWVNEEIAYDVLKGQKHNLYVVNAYTQYSFGSKHGPPVDYEAITLCMRKINHLFKDKHIGLPLIGCGLAGGDWSIVKETIREELQDMNVTIVHFKPEEDVPEHETEV